MLGETAVVSVSTGIPWYFAPMIVVLAALIVVLLVKSVAALFAHRLNRNARQDGYHAAPYKSGGTLLAFVCALAAGVLVGVNYDSIWYVANPGSVSADDNVHSVREQFAAQGVDDLRLRETSPQHPVEVLDPNAWDRGWPLTHLLACDASGVNEFGQYPAYEGFEWSLPVGYSGASSPTSSAGTLTRTVADDQCHFALERD